MRLRRTVVRYAAAPPAGRPACSLSGERHHWASVRPVQHTPAAPQRPPFQACAGAERALLTRSAEPTADLALCSTATRLLPGHEEDHHHRRARRGWHRDGHFGPRRQRLHLRGRPRRGRLELHCCRRVPGGRRRGPGPRGRHRRPVQRLRERQGHQPFTEHSPWASMECHAVCGARRAARSGW